MTPFHVTLHRLPAETSNGPAWSEDGHTFLTLLPAGKVPAELFEVSFETAVDRLQSLPRMFVEPDGSFVWVGDAPQSWQLDGNLYDRAGQLVYVELKGTCSLEAFGQFREAIGAPSGGMMVQLLRQAVYLSEDDFVAFACR